MLTGSTAAAQRKEVGSIPALSSTGESRIYLHSAERPGISFYSDSRKDGPPEVVPPAVIRSIGVAVTPLPSKQASPVRIRYAPPAGTQSQRPAIGKSLLFISPLADSPERRHRRLSHGRRILRRGRSGRVLSPFPVRPVRFRPASPGTLRVHAIPCPGAVIFSFLPIRFCQTPGGGWAARITKGGSHGAEKCHSQQRTGPVY